VANHTHNRSEEEIVANILVVILDRARKTRIMYRTNLSSALTGKYLHKLQGCGLIQYDEEAKEYLLTNSGRRYLDLYAEYKVIKGKLVSHISLLEEKRDILTQMLTARRREPLEIIS